MRSKLSAAVLALLIGGCAAVPPPSPSRLAVKAAVKPADAPHRAGVVRRPAHVAKPLALPGLAGVIGATPNQLVALFGPPRLDIVEGDARKLQFSAKPCVLDAYLYPPAPGRTPETTYLDARLGDGRNIDRAGCVAALRRR